MNARLILAELDKRLDSAVELTLYGRAAIQLGFPNPPPDTYLSLDVDAVLWIGQAEELNETTNFWEAVDQVNQSLAEQGLYISHFFTEDMVVLRPGWRSARVKIAGGWTKLRLYRLADMDLLLSKLMRDDPQDQQDALFIVQAAALSREQLDQGLREARLPKIPEVAEQFAAASRRLLSRLSAARPPPGSS